MSTTVVILGALDTKGPDFAYVRDAIQKAGLPTLVVDCGVMGSPYFEPDIDREAVAGAGGGTLSHLAAGDQKDQAMQTMARGSAVVVRQLYDEGKLGGIISMGGTGGTSVATTAMRTLPLHVPKLMVSTVGGGDVSAYAGTSNITFMPSIVDVAGLNSISRGIYASAAGAIAGMVRVEAPVMEEEKPLVAASMFGNTTKAVDHAREHVTQAGYEVLVFHATGMGGRMMESLIDDGYFTASLDITTTELADHVCGGVFDAGPERCLAAARKGVPTVIVPGCVDMANFGGIDTVPEKYRDRNLYEWNPNVTLLRTNIEENRTIGRMIAAAANASKGPVAVLLPYGGVSMLDSEGNRFWDPEADAACFDAIKEDLASGVPVIESEHNINDPAFARLAADTLVDLLANGER